ncbi:MAG: DUF2142 domain-containing protein [Acidothermus sp.]|nr:DUF2142 domain-containing protein [Acidothermus sp.]
MTMGEKRRTVLAIGGATLLLAAIFTIWAAVTPPFRAPDEPQHVSTIISLAYRHSYPPAGAARLDPAIAEAEVVTRLQAALLAASPLRQPPSKLYESVSLRELGRMGDSTVPEPDQMTQHPPGYYLLLAIPARLFDVFDRSTQHALFILRLCSAALLLPIPYLTYRLSRDLGVSLSSSRAAAFLPAALPQFDHLGGSVNNDALMITLGALLTVLAVRFAQRPPRVLPAIGLGLAYAAALWVKGLALPLGVLVLGAYALSGHRWGWRRALKPALLTFSAMCLGAVWWVLNLLRLGQIQPNGYPPGYLDAMLDGTLPFAGWARYFSDLVARSFWLDYGWTEMSPPRAAYLTASAALIAVIVVAAFRARRYRAEFVLSQLPGICLLLAITWQSYTAWLRWHTVTGAQGRYLYPGLAAMAAAVPLAVSRHRPRNAPIVRRDFLRRLLPAILPVAVWSAAAIGIERGVHHFYFGNDLIDRVGMLSAWSPLRMRFLAIVAAVSVIAGVAGVIAQWAHPGRERHGQPSVPVSNAAVHDA